MQVGDAGLAALCEYGVTRRLRSLSLEQTNVTNWGGTAILELRGSLGHTDCGHDLLGNCPPRQHFRKHCRYGAHMLHTRRRQGSTRTHESYLHVSALCPCAPGHGHR